MLYIYVYVYLSINVNEQKYIHTIQFIHSYNMYIYICIRMSYVSYKSNNGFES